jgi:tetratricopeptide (TPR) repeat protein
MSKRLDMLDTMIAKGSQDPFVHYARAMELRSLERFDDALAAYQQVMQTFPDYVPTYLMAGQVAERLGRLDEARAALEAGIAAAQRTGDGHALGELRGLLAGLD